MNDASMTITSKPAYPSIADDARWKTMGASEIIDELSSLADQILVRADQQRPHIVTARRLGFAIGPDWATVRAVLESARTMDPEAFLTWSDGCYNVIYRAPSLPPARITDFVAPF